MQAGRTIDMTTQTLDPAKAMAFGGQMMGMLNGAFSTLMVSVGHRLGVFDTLATMPPSTSQQIAKATGLNERYIREWLGGMTVARVIEHDPVKGTYWLPAEHAAAITHAAGPGDMGVFAEFLSQMGNVEDKIVESFQKGGGAPYAMFPKFQQMMGNISTGVVDATLLDLTLPLVPGLVDRLRAGISVVDVGCGQGHAINVMAKAFPASKFTGYDFSDEGVATARAEAKQMGLSNATFEKKDVATIDGSAKFDFITAFDSIHDQAQPRKVLKGIAGALNPGGVFLMIDIAADSTHAGNMDHPLGPVFYTISTFHCMTVSLALGGEGLGNMWGEQKARELLAEAGFKDVAIKHVEGDIMNAYYICKK
jgi:2-polyprenyl-3-methyl-5-hydroxy-6-metoxy-1,4-benzoquinol methylase